jgi:hypothetical protein
MTLLANIRYKHDLPKNQFFPITIDLIAHLGDFQKLRNASFPFITKTLQIPLFLMGSFSYYAMRFFRFLDPQPSSSS